MTTDDTVLSVTGVCKTFSSGRSAVRALDMVDLDVRKGEMIMLMGPSGSGKTTLLSIMGCILRADSGKINLAGKELSGLPERELAKVRLSHIGFIFQSYNLFPTLNATENVMTAFDLKGYPREKAREESIGLLRAVGLGERLENFPRDLSGGEKQRVAAARALAGEPDAILADEPTAALDSRNGRMLMELLHNLTRERGRSVVVVTHDARVKDYADRIASMEDGRIVSL